MERTNFNLSRLTNDGDSDESRDNKWTTENSYHLTPRSIKEANSHIHSVVSSNSFLPNSSLETAQLGRHLFSEKSLSQFKSPVKKCSEGTEQMSDTLGQENISGTMVQNIPTEIKRRVPLHKPTFNWHKPLTLGIAPSTSMNTSTPSRPRGQIRQGGEKILICGTQVEFPYEPYPVQKYMISQLLKAVKGANHCLLESPTGTGKTLALLCSTLAWQKREEELLQELRLLTEANNAQSQRILNETRKSLPLTKDLERPSMGTPSTSNNTVIELSDSDSEDIFQSPKYKKKKADCEKSPIKNDFNSTTENKLDECSNIEGDANEDEAVTDNKTSDVAISTESFRAPKIFYGTRTHKQIAQVIEQLEKTTYASKVKMTILAARDHTCVNDSVRQSSNVTEKCQSLIDPIAGLGCSYYTGSSKGTSHQILQSCGLPQVYDIEDIVNVGKRHKICPYFSLRNLVTQSDIIFCPYNYLIDPSIRESMNINVAKSVVIMDEAHNIEDTCRSAGSLWLRQMELDEAITECQDNMHIENNREEYFKIQEFLIMIVNWLTSNGPNIPYSGEGESVKSIAGIDVINWFNTEGITQEKFQEMKDSVTKINQKRIEFPEDNRMISGKVKQITSSITIVLNYLYKPENVSKYQAYFFRDIKQNKVQTTKGSWLTNHRNKQTERLWQYNLHLVCLSPEVVFSELLNARSIVLASGTLSPLETFQSELGVKFPNVVKGWHVVPVGNMFVSAVAKGPHRLELKGVYENANKYEYQDELGRSILETIKIVPHGVLCFFPSYYLMDKLKERWISTGLFEELEKMKEMFWEPRGKQDMNRIMTAFTERIELSVDNPVGERGAILFGVFRGKIAEGIDFSDDMARAVISVGIPFMNMNSKEISLKMRYNTDNTYKILPGYQWYRIQAYRALNQALGRCIRHSKDWGAVILMDSRLCSEDSQKNLPKWILQQMLPFQSWDGYLKGLSAFCHRMNEKDRCASSVSRTPNV